MGEDMEIFVALNCNIKDVGKFPLSYNPDDTVLMFNGNPCPIGFINGYGSITQYSKKRIHRNIEFKDDIVNTTILPKGTLLFRASSRNIPNNDFKGIAMNDYNIAGKSIRKHYLHSHHNIFFYPYPYVVDKIFINGFDQYMYIYVLTHDVEIMLGVEPSTNTRVDRYDTEQSYITSCDKVTKSSNPKIEGRDYDPCFTNEFISDNPEVVGMMVMAKADTDVHIASNTDEKFFTKYRSNFIDNASNVGVPEIILYPLNKRRIEELEITPYTQNNINNIERSQFYLNDTFLKKPESAKQFGSAILNSNFLKREDYNYALFDIIERDAGFNYDGLWKFMEAGCSPLGSESITKMSENYNTKTSMYGSLKNYHITIDLATKMYVVYELCSPEIQARCVPIEEPYKFRYLNNNYNI